MNDNPKEPWLFESPYARIGIPSFVGVVIGFFTNLLTGIAVNNGLADWSKIFFSWISFGILASFLAGIWYQVKAHKYDNEPANVLEKAKQAQAANIARFYERKIQAGDIEELKKADEAMQRIFGGVR